MRQLKEIIIHCTATRPNWWADKTSQEKTEEVRRWHVEDRKWSDCGYHYLIDRRGEVTIGRPLEKTGSHVKGHNTGTIGISLFGGHGGSASDTFYDHFTEEQEWALEGLIISLTKDYPTISKVTGHNQYAAKACPCFSVPAWRAGAKAKPLKPLVPTEASQGRTSPVQSTTLQAAAVQAMAGISGALGALQALDGTAQIVAISGGVLVTLLAIWVVKERLRYWAAGVH
jgi:N-acetylmuramoyl-L-alanine amidase